jgi:uncharacterized protein (DUF2267 family)
MIWATMVTLAERMSHDELVRLGAWLPEKLQAAAHAGSPACEPFGADEAVLGTLEREVAEMEPVRQRLPREFDALMA